MTPTVRVGTEADARAAADLHAGEIGEGFLSSLGPRFLRRLYRRVVVWPRSFLLVADDGGEVVGFISGAEDTGALYRAFLRADAVPAGLAALPRLARQPKAVLETLRYGTGSGAGAGAGAGAGEQPRAELLATAVTRRARGKGIGRALVEAHNRELVARGIDTARVVVGAGNQAATALYRACGYEPAATIEVHRGARSEVLVWRAS